MPTDWVEELRRQRVEQRKRKAAIVDSLTNEERTLFAKRYLPIEGEWNREKALGHTPRQLEREVYTVRTQLASQGRLQDDTCLYCGAEGQASKHLLQGC